MRRDDAETFWANVNDVTFGSEAKPIKPALPASMKRRRFSLFRFIKIPPFLDQFPSSILRCLCIRRDPHPNLLLKDHGGWKSQTKTGELAECKLPGDFKGINFRLEDELDCHLCPASVILLVGHSNLTKR